MTATVMITNGGPHSAALWAEQTSKHIVHIAEHLAGEKREAAVKLQAKVIDILEHHHTVVQVGERAAIEEHGHDRLLHDHDCSDHCTVEDIVNEIIAAAADTAWAEDFKKPEAIEHVTAVLTSHFATSMNIERSWHADRNPDTEQAKAFCAKHRPGA